MKDEFPDLDIQKDCVSISAWGYKACWKVGVDAQNLLEAATLAQTVWKAGRHHFRSFDTLKRRFGLHDLQFSFSSGNSFQVDADDTNIL